MSQTRTLTVDVEFPDDADPATVHTALIDHLNEVAYVSNDHGFRDPDAAVALLTDNGVTEDGRRVLVHVWADGTGELAYAPQGTTSWGVPFPLVPAP